MNFHFADFLPREEDYWTMVPNIERYAYNAREVIDDKDSVKVLTITKVDEHWRQVFECPDLEELTLMSPTKEQVNAITKLNRIKRLRITFLRTKDIDFIAGLTNVKELVLEYVSGFSDLSPIQELKQLRSLHLENLRRVKSYDGLRGCDSLKYLYISGTLDWFQPVNDLSFVEGLPNLEVFNFGFVVSHQPYPATLPLTKLKQLKSIWIPTNTFRTNEYALMQAGMPQVKGTDWALWRLWESSNRIEFLGKFGGWVTPGQPNTEKRCEEFRHEFERMKQEAITLIQ